MCAASLKRSKDLQRDDLPLLLNVVQYLLLPLLSVFGVGCLVLFCHIVPCVLSSFVSISLKERET